MCARVGAGEWGEAGVCVDVGVGCGKDVAGGASVQAARIGKTRAINRQRARIISPGTLSATLPALLQPVPRRDGTSMDGFWSSPLDAIARRCRTDGLVFPGSQ